MDNQVNFYPHRIKTGLLGILMLGAIYIIYTKVLVDSYGITATATVVLWGTVAVALVVGIVYLIKTIDPRPVVEISPEGMVIRTFIFLEDFVPWEEVVDIGHEQHTNRVVNTAGYVKVTANFLRIYRPQRRSLAINLTLLNTRGNAFEEALIRFLPN